MSKPRICRDRWAESGYICASFETGRLGIFPRWVKGSGDTVEAAYAHWAERMRNQGLLK